MFSFNNLIVATVSFKSLLLNVSSSVCEHLLFCLQEFLKYLIISSKSFLVIDLISRCIIFFNMHGMITYSEVYLYFFHLDIFLLFYSQKILLYSFCFFPFYLCLDICFIMPPFNYMLDHLFIFGSFGLFFFDFI